MNSLVVAEAAVQWVVVALEQALRVLAGRAARAFGERARDRQHGRVQQRRDRVASFWNDK